MIELEILAEKINEAQQELIDALNKQHELQLQLIEVMQDYIEYLKNKLSI